MKTKVLKSLLLAAAAIVLVVASVLGTMAYLTSSAAVSNVFTIGNVKLHMYETPVYPDGTPKVVISDGEMKTADTNSYHLIPGSNYLKDPTVYVDATSDKSYLFIRLRNDLKTIEKQGDPSAPTILEQLKANGWLEIERAESNVDAVFVYVGKDDNIATRIAAAEAEVKAAHPEYKPNQVTAAVLEQLDDVKAEVVGGTGTRQDIDVFGEFTLANEIDGLERFGGARVAIVAYAIQINGLSTSGEIGSQEAYQAAWQYVKAELPFVD